MEVSWYFFIIQSGYSDITLIQMTHLHRPIKISIAIRRFYIHISIIIFPLFTLLR